MVSLACGVPAPAPVAERNHRRDADGERTVRPGTLKFDVGPPRPTIRPAKRSPPKGFVALAEVDATLRIDMRYATAANFTGAPLPGYVPGAAWVTTETGEALGKVQASLSDAGLGLLIFDAYRPKRATDAMVAWAKRTGQTQLLDDGYVAPLSDHNRGNTVDLTLVSLEDGKELEMGTAWDTFSPASHYTAAHGEAAVNRKRLRQAMVAQGFAPYAKEWWHFTLGSEPAPPVRDTPYHD